MPLRRTIWSILLVGLVLTNVFSMPVMRLGYAVNKTYIIENFCTNRQKPQLHCDGKCYLKANLKKANQENPNQTDFKAKSLSYDYMGPQAAFVASVHLPSAMHHYSSYKAGAYYNYSYKILHPPQV